MRIVRFGPMLLLLVVLGGYVVYPLAMTVRESLMVDGTLSLSRYRDLINPANAAGWESLGNSLLVSLLSVVCSGAVGVLLAVTFTQTHFPLKKFFARLAIIPIALPPLVGVIAFLFVFGESGIIPRVLQGLLGLASAPFALGGMSAIVVVHTYSFSVYFFLFVSTALRRLDASTLEAAASLGGPPWYNILRIVFPELRPALLGASVLTFMASMASFSAPFLFAGGRQFMTLQIYSSKLNGELDAAAAQSVGLAFVSILFFVLLHFSGYRDATSYRTRGAVRSGSLPIGSGMKSALVSASLILLALEMLPIATIVLISFAREGSWTWQVLPTSYTLGNYAKLLGDPHVFEPMRNSMAMSALTLSAALLVGIPAAYVVTKGRLKRSRFAVDLLVTMPFALPGTVVAVGLILAFNSPNLFDGYHVIVGTFWILPLAYFVRTFPLMVRSTAAALERVDDSLLEAAQTFGAGALTRFRRIALPIVLPGIVAGSVLIVIAALGEFVSSILLYTYSSRPVSVEILSQMRTYNFGAAAAECVFLLIVILAVTSLPGRILRGRGKGEFSG